MINELKDRAIFLFTENRNRSIESCVKQAVKELATNEYLVKCAIMFDTTTNEIKENLKSTVLDSVVEELKGE